MFKNNNLAPYKYRESRFLTPKSHHINFVSGRLPTVATMPDPKSLKKQLQQYISTFAQVASTLACKGLEKRVVKLGPLNDAHNENVTENLKGVWELKNGPHSILLRFGGDYNKQCLIDIATNLFTHTAPLPRVLSKMQ